MAELPLDAMIAALPLPTVAIDADERIVGLNPAAADLIGQGMRGRHFVTALRQPALVEVVEQCLRDGTPRLATYHGGDTQTPVTYEVHLRKVDSSGIVMLSFGDMSHLQQAGAMRRDFVANVSHELRTPLTSLMGFIETLRGPAKDDAGARDRFLGIMSDEAGRMNRLIGDLLSLSRVEAQERQRPTERINLVALLTATLRNLSPLANERSVALKPDFGDRPLHVLGDHDQLLQVFTNLVENAIKYGDADQTVHISMRHLDHEPSLRAAAVQVSVRDQGPGIDPLHLPRLTERFYRADSHRSRALGGTGLGLAIVKHILNRHRGRLRIASELGKGSEFTALLPLEKGATDD